MSQFEPSTREEWDRFVSGHPEANFLQSWQWGDAHLAQNFRILRHKLVVDGSIGAIVLGIIKDAKRGRYLEIAGGPLVDWTDEVLVRELIEQIKTYARVHECVFIRIRPQAQHINLRVFGGRPAQMHLHAEHTSMLDVIPDEETLLERMRQQTRYEVKRAPRRDIDVRVEQSQGALERFTRMQADTAARQHFIPSSPVFLTAIMHAFGSDFSIYEAYKDGQLLNSALIISWGQEVDYFEAASTPEARKEPGAYAILWQAIQDAKTRGITRCNFWGIAPNDNPHHRYAKVTTFKRGFGGDDVTYTHAHDFVIKPLAYTKNWIVESVRKRRRKLS